MKLKLCLYVLGSYKKSNNRYFLSFQRAGISANAYTLYFQIQTISLFGECWKQLLQMLVGYCYIPLHWYIRISCSPMKRMFYDYLLNRILFYWHFFMGKVLQKHNGFLLVSRYSNVMCHYLSNTMGLDCSIQEPFKPLTIVAILLFRSGLPMVWFITCVS